MNTALYFERCRGAELTVLLEMEGDGHLVWSHAAILIKYLHYTFSSEGPAVNCTLNVLLNLQELLFYCFMKDVANQSSLIKE